MARSIAMLDRLEDRAELGLSDWHLCVLLDDVQPLDPQGMNQRDLAGDTPLDMAYRLNRSCLIDTLELLGARGNPQIRGWAGRGSFMPHDKYIHLPARYGNVKTLQARYRLGASLNRDGLGNTPLHWLLVNGHLKAARYFIDRYVTFGLDLGAKNHQGNTVRNIALLNGHHALAQQLLTAEIDNCIRALRLWREMGLNHA
ncbi:ankyrin repeat domain-containing protein [Pseudomonas helleri]|uniref:Ankyrin repeat domain-containing protein n=1 Tax=Pseudomonas helleri TaxID=1608996 RepID=A0A7X1Y4A8_9PSED|nr:ankyrin repeat domain-containing protein [Pseudomonas helleri]MQT94938.1 ankyrin repeat domain-containing protein [Pseudomonas helleri]MQU30314.1 ankyrin repeat domain-containing protein [Pseudomonas helleri]